MRCHACYSLGMNFRMGLIVCMLFGLSACSSSRSKSKSHYMMPYTDGGSTAPAAAYAADDFTFRKSMPDRRDWKPWEFYYKHCSEAGQKAYFSKTAYDCSGPYY